ncbi:MAG: Flp pilus assembly complex ATPase component TadA [Planctomycetaceae bacterium]|nr:Flp pilus assembly complex ATPase component TadA [Planctomycetaceae bacterium]
MSNVRRVLLIVMLGTAVLACWTGAAMAAGDWGATPLAKDFRGPGCYLSWIKIVACWLVFAAWVYTANWLNIDCQDLKLNSLKWNPIVFGSFMAAFVLSWLIPNFWIAFVLLLAAYIAPLSAYVSYRNKQVDVDRRVLTADHLRFWFATQLKKVGIKVNTARRDPREGGVPLKLLAKGGPDQRTDNTRLLQARQSLGFGTAREILAEGVGDRASSIMLDFTQQGVAIRSMIDGVWIAREAKTREVGDPAIEALKLLCGANPQDRQGRQAGTFAFEYESARYSATFASQGTPTGERVLLQFEAKKVPFTTLDEIGMRPKLQEQLTELLGQPKGFTLFSAAPAGGLRSMVDVSLRVCDRFTREFAAVEDERKPYEPVENVPVTRYDSAAGQSPTDVLVSLFRKEPNVVVVRDLVDAETLHLMCEETKENRMLIGTVRARDAAEAILRTLMLGIAPEEFANALTGVVCQRLVRKLCDSCKEAYTPPPQVLQQLGIQEGRAPKFYRPPQPNPEESKETCPVCGGLGYLGRTALFEVLTVGDAVRNAIVSGAKLPAMRQAARQDGMKTFQEEGVLLVVKGVTSLPELMRVLK